MSNRKELLAERMRQRLWEIQKAVPPIDPPAVHWLNGDSCNSYCWECAVKARGEEFDLGVPLTPRRWHRTDLEDAFYDGIDGGFDGESDTTEACDTCGRTLSYILTDYGVDEEIAYYLESPLTAVRDEDSYAIDRLALNVWHGSKTPQLLGACAVINQAWRIVTQTKDTHHG